MKVTIISVGRANDVNIQNLIDDYARRLNFKLNWILLPPQNVTGDTNKTKLKESLLIAKKIGSEGSSYKILLDETGQNITSNKLAEMFNSASVQSLNLIFIIGGAYGVDEVIKQKVDFVWSLSKLVFPHQLVRLILTEQIYRANSINRGSNYHHV